MSLVQLRLEALESRNLASVTSTFDGQVLNLAADPGGKHSVLVRPAAIAGAIEVLADGAFSSYATPTRINYTGANQGTTFTNRTGIPGTLLLVRGDNVVNTTAANSMITVGDGDNFVQALAGNNTITAGNGKNSLYGGPGDTITAGTGANLIYDILPGNQTITVGAGNATSYLFVGPGTTLTGNQPQDKVARFFAPGRTPGSGSLVLDQRTLYFTASNSGDSYSAIPLGSQILVIYRVGIGSQQLAFFNAADVDLIANFGGAGNDYFYNGTGKPDVQYGAGGQNYLVGGFGPLNLLKAGGAAGNSVAIGNSPVYNDLNGSGGMNTTSTLIAAGNSNRVQNVFRTNSPTDVLIGRGGKDILISLFPDLVS